MHSTKQPTETVALIRNKLYKTYQFHGILGRGKDPDTVFRTAIAEIFLWLRERFREFDQVPVQIVLPGEVSKITDDQLKSFRIDDGYIIETIYISSEKIWSFRLTEPDMGTKERKSVPGRLFMTNFGLRIINENVEFGSMTVCSQPETILEDAEVFRPKVVRTLKDKLGLFSIVDLEYKAGDLSDNSVMKKFKALLEDKNRNMPVIVLERKCKNTCNNILIMRSDPEPFYGKSEAAASYFPELKFKHAIKVDRIESANKLARSLCGFAYIFYFEQGQNNCIKTYYHGEEEQIFNQSDQSDSDYLDLIDQKFITKMMNYPKRNESYSYGNVCFVSGALLLKQELDLKKLQKTDDFVNENRKLKQIIESLEEENKREVQSKRDFAEKYQEEKDRRKAAEHRLNLNTGIWDNKEQNYKKEIHKLELQLEEHLGTITEYISKERRPTNITSFIKWVDEFFSEDIILLSRAKDELRKAQNCDIDMLNDAIEVLAKYYRQKRLGNMPEDKYIEGCKSYGKNAFEITPTGDASIKKHPKEYKVFYGDGPRVKSNKRALDWHLKNGVNPKFLLRIYFFWDDEIKKIVIGSMPNHLSSVE